MIFLIEYDRQAGAIVSRASFEDADRSRAERARLDLELKLHREGINHEVVILEAASLEALHRTHNRYFETPGQIIGSTASDLRGSGEKQSK